MDSSIQAELVPSLDDQTNVQEEGVESQLLVTCSTGDDKIDPFLLSALNNPRDRLLLLKLDHELERFVNDPTKQRLEFPPMSSYQRLIVHRVAQYFLLDHAAVDVDNLKRAVVLFKSPQSRVPVLRLTDLREEPDATPQKAVKIMRRAPNVNGRNYSMSGGPGERAQTDKTLEERETEYAKARARIFNESVATTPSEKQTTGNINNSTNNNGSTNDSNVSSTADGANGDTTGTNSTTNTKEDLGTNASHKRSTVSNAPVKSRRGFSHDGADGLRKYADAGISDVSFYPQDIASYRGDQAFSLHDGGFMMDGKDRMPPYPIGHFDPDGMFAGNIDSYMAGHALRFDGYDFPDYAGAQEVPNAWGMPPHHPSFYPFGRGAGYAGDGMMGKGDSPFYFDFVPAKEWTPPSSMGGLPMNSPLSANATPFEPSSHSQAHAANPSSPTAGPNSSTGPNPSIGPSVINTNNTINTFNTINTYNTINNINTINIINTNNNKSNPTTSSLSSTTPGVHKSSKPTSTSTSPPLPTTSPVPPSTSPTLPSTTSTSMSSRVPTTYKVSPTPTTTTPKTATPTGANPSFTTSPPTTSPPTTSNSSSSTGGVPKNSATTSARTTTSPPSPPSFPHTHPRDSISPPKFTPSSSIPPFPRTTTPPLSSSQVPSSAQQLPPPAQIPMQPPPIYRLPPTPAQFGFDAGPWGPPYPYPPFPPASQYHPLAQPPPHPLTHPHLYPPHPQFLPSQSVSFGNGAIYAHPFLGPSPVQKPIASLDYERRPPKSTELFDPKAPPPPKRQQAPLQQVESSMRQMSLYPSPHSPAQTHAPNLTTQQGVKKQPSTSSTSSTKSQPSSQSPILPHTTPLLTKPPQTSPPTQPLHQKLSTSSSTTPSQPRAPIAYKLPAQTSSQQVPQQSPLLTPSLTSSVTPSQQDQMAPRLLYDYPQQQGVYVPPDHTPPPAVAHILEIYDFSSSTPISPSPSFLDHPIFADLKKAGASIKILDSSVFIAIFRNGAASRKALENWESECTTGRVCGYSLRQWAPAFTSGSVSQPVPERESEA